MNSLPEEMKHRTCHLKLRLWACLGTVQILRKEEKKNLHQSSYAFHCLYLHKDNQFLDEQEFELTNLQFRADSILLFYETIYILL